MTFFLSGITPNIPRMFTALAEWSACLLYILTARPRDGLDGRKLPWILASFLVIQIFFLELTGDLPLAYWFPCMGVAASIMLCLIWLCCDIDLPSAIYVTAMAFLLAELAASLEWQIYYYIAERFGPWDPPVSLLFLFPLYILFFLVVYLIERWRGGPSQLIPLRPNELALPLAITLGSFCVGNLSFVVSDTPFSATVIGDIHTIRTLADLAGVVTLYAYHIQRAELLTRQELASIQSILQNQYAQYQQSRENIELINHKYHDLKHQIGVLRAETDPERRSAFLDGMEEDIREYEAQNKTGNPVLDTVLTSKSLYCVHHDVELTCVADGSLLDSLSVMDICTIFGNLLDNAIECELRIADKSKRLIHLMVYSRKDLLVIQCENYCEELPVFEDSGLPHTTKQDPAYHGYGLKSIRYTAEKYGGSLSVNTRENWFELNIVIPLAERS